MTRVLLQAGHSAAFAPNRTGGGGAPGEAAWATDLTNRIADRLQSRGIEVARVGAWLVNGVVVSAPQEARKDADLFCSLHYDADIYATRTGSIAARAANDPMGAVADHFLTIWKHDYPSATGVPLHQERVNANMTDYYAFRDTSEHTPGVILEHGVGQGLDHTTLFDHIDLIADTDSKAICEFLGVPWEETPTPDPCFEISEALRLANWRKHEFEFYIRDSAHRQSVDDAAAGEGIAPVDLMLRWAKDNWKSGEPAP